MGPSQHWLWLRKQEDHDGRLNPHPLLITGVVTSGISENYHALSWARTQDHQVTVLHVSSELARRYSILNISEFVGSLVRPGISEGPSELVTKCLAHTMNS